MDASQYEQQDEKSDAKQPKNGKQPVPIDTANAVAVAESESINEWLKQTFIGDQSVKIKLYRNAPATFLGVPCKGYLTEFNELITEDQVKEVFGGGVYRAHTWKLNAKGNWDASGTKVFTIAGNPRVDEGVLPKLTQEKMGAGILQAPLPPSAVDQAMTMMADVTNQERKRSDKMAEEMRSHKQIDPELIATVTRPYEAQLQTMAETIRSLQDQLTGALNRKPETAFQDRMLEKMVDGESARLTTLREQFASEMRVLKENHHAELVRKDEQSNRREERMEQASLREIQTVKSSCESQITSIKVAYEGRIEGMKMQLDTVTQSLSDTRQELVALRSQKDEGPLEQLQKMVTMRDAFKALGGNDDEPEEQSTFEKIAQAAAPMIQGIADRVAAGGPQQQGGPVPAGYVQQQLEPAQQQQPPQQQTPFIGVTKAELQQAMSFVELAIRNQTKPEVFAASARSQIPGAIIEAIKTMGADAFIQRLPLQEGSPLQSMAGIQYLRAVIKVLMEPTE